MYEVRGMYLCGNIQVRNSPSWLVAYTTYNINSVYLVRGTYVDTMHVHELAAKRFFELVTIAGVIPRVILSLFLFPSSPNLSWRTATSYIHTCKQYPSIPQNGEANNPTQHNTTTPAQAPHTRYERRTRT